MSMTSKEAFEIAIEALEEVKVNSIEARRDKLTQALQTLNSIVAAMTKAEIHTVDPSALGRAFFWRLLAAVAGLYAIYGAIGDYRDQRPLWAIGWVVLGAFSLYAAYCLHRSIVGMRTRLR